MQLQPQSDSEKKGRRKINLVAMLHSTSASKELHVGLLQENAHFEILHILNNKYLLPSNSVLETLLIQNHHHSAQNSQSAPSPLEGDPGSWSGKTSTPQIGHPSQTSSFASHLPRLSAGYNGLSVLLCSTPYAFLCNIGISSFCNSLSSDINIIPLLSIANVYLNREIFSEHFM